jgi:hypothetical protein
MSIKNHNECVSLLKEAQETEDDNREMCREADLFINKRDGQWEPAVISKWTNRPRYTFAEINPIIDGIMGEIEAMDFGINVTPAGNQATKDVAKLYSGMIRTIHNISKPTAGFVYNQAARVMVSTGFDAWRVVTDYRDDDSFQQDLMIKHIPNAQDCVWFDPNAELPDMSDSDFAWNLTSVTKRYFEKKWPEGSGQSVDQSLFQQSWFNKKPDEIVVGEALYKKTKYRELVLMTNGEVFVVDEDFMRVKDELAQAGIEVNRTRKRPYSVVYQRMFDQKDWLDSEKDTVFCYIPIVPVFGNFRISENKVIYWGMVEKLMDSQRVINYSESRKIEEGALSPKGKIWMTKDQAKSKSVKDTLRTLNVNNDPVQQYDHVEGQPPPQYTGTPPSNPNLIETTQTAQNFIQRTSGSYDEDRGTAPPRRSGIAIEKLQSKSNAPKRKWITSLEVAIAHTAEILIKAIPKVYDSQQIMVITGEDGSTDTVTLHKKVRDEQTGNVVTLNNLNQGKYGVVCKAGPAFHTKQAETVAAIVDYAQIDNTILQLGADVLLNNINAPGIDKLAARKRRQMVVEGLIPPDQMTDEEKELLKQQSENMSPVDRANLMIAEAELQRAQGENSERAIKAELEQTKLQLKQMELAMKAQKDQDSKMLDAMKQLNEQIKTQAETLKLIREASGAESIVSPAVTAAYEEQARELVESVKTQ